MIKFLDLEKQYQSIKTEIDQAIQSVIAESAFIGGKYVQAFEEHFATYQQTQFCIGVGNGTDALEIAIEGLGITNSEIIVPANSFIATAEAVTRTGNRVVFCDCNPQNYTISITDLQKRITPDTKAIIAVHLYGHPCDMEPLLHLAQTHDIIVIEDCAQAHGAEYKGNRVGAIGTIGTFSFYPGKNLGAYGDGGAIVTNDQELAIKCRMLANHGRLEKHNHQIEGRNSRLDGLQAAILDVKLNYLEDWLHTRNEIAGYYYEHLNKYDPIILPTQASWAKHAYHLFVTRAQHRDALQQHLKNQGIQTGIHYPTALPKLSAYNHIGQAHETMLANQMDRELLSLPIGEHLTASEMDTILSEVTKFMTGLQ